MRTVGLLILSSLLLLMLTACGQPAASVPPPPSPTTVSTATLAGPVIVPVLAVSELDIGPNRIALGILQDGTPINDPKLELGLRFFYLDGDIDTQVQSESSAVYRGEGLPFGLYVGYATFDQPGDWNVEISVPSSPEAQVYTMRLTVNATPHIPSIGQAAVPSQNLTIRDNPNLNEISSDPQPDADFYQMTIAEALAAKKPFVVGFLTPSYCQTAVCGPNMAVMKALKTEFHDQVNFIHVEVYPYPFNEAYAQQRLVEAMNEWNLRTEPWTFLIDANGIIQYRYEGGITFAEMQAALTQLAAGEPVTPLTTP